MINFLKILELLILGFFFPLTVVYFKLSQFILLFLWIISLYAILALLIFYREEISFKKVFYIEKNIHLFCYTMGFSCIYKFFVSRKTFWNTKTGYKFTL